MKIYLQKQIYKAHNPMLGYYIKESQKYIAKI